MLLMKSLNILKPKPQMLYMNVQDVLSDESSYVL